MQIRLSFSLSKGALKKKKNERKICQVRRLLHIFSFSDVKHEVQLATKVTEMDFVQELALY